MYHEESNNLLKQLKMNFEELKEAAKQNILNLGRKLGKEADLVFSNIKIDESITGIGGKNKKIEYSVTSFLYDTPDGEANIIVKKPVGISEEDERMIRELERILRSKKL